MSEGRCGKCGGEYAANVIYDDGHLVKVDIGCNKCGDEVCSACAIRNYKNMRLSSSCMLFSNGTYYCGAMPVGKPEWLI